VQALPGAWHGGPGFEGYGAGEGLLHGVRGAVEAAGDAVRWWSEQCDSLQGGRAEVGWGWVGAGRDVDTLTPVGTVCAPAQVPHGPAALPHPMRAPPCLTPPPPPPGVQVLCDDLSGFGGLSRRLLDELREELPGAKLLYFSLRPPEPAAGGSGGDGGMRPVRWGPATRFCHCKDEFPHRGPTRGCMPCCRLIRRSAPS
jgi:hypothetical protein